MPKTYKFDVGQLGFADLCDEKIWELQELYAGNIARLKDFIDIMDSHDFLDEVTVTVNDFGSHVSPVKPKPRSVSRPSVAKPKKSRKTVSKQQLEEATLTVVLPPEPAVQALVEQHVKQQPQSVQPPIEEVAVEDKLVPVVEVAISPIEAHDTQPVEEQPMEYEAPIVFDESMEKQVEPIVEPVAEPIAEQVDQKPIEEAVQIVQQSVQQSVATDQPIEQQAEQLAEDMPYMPQAFNKDVLLQQTQPEEAIDGPDSIEDDDDTGNQTQGNVTVADGSKTGKSVRKVKLMRKKPRNTLMPTASTAAPPRDRKTFGLLPKTPSAALAAKTPGLAKFKQKRETAGFSLAAQLQEKLRKEMKAAGGDPNKSIMKRHDLEDDLPTQGDILPLESPVLQTASSDLPAHDSKEVTEPVIEMTESVEAIMESVPAVDNVESEVKGVQAAVQVQLESIEIVPVPTAEVPKQEVVKPLEEASSQPANVERANAERPPSHASHSSYTMSVERPDYVKKPRAEPRTLAFPSLADTVSKVDANLVHEQGRIDGVLTKSTEESKKEEQRVKSVLQTNVDKLKGDLSRLLASQKNNATITLGNVNLREALEEEKGGSINQLSRALEAAKARLSLEAHSNVQASTPGSGLTNKTKSVSTIRDSAFGGLSPVTDRFAEEKTKLLAEMAKNMDEEDDVLEPSQPVDWTATLNLDQEKDAQRAQEQSHNRKIEIKALAAAAAAREKELQDKEKRAKPKDLIEERRLQALHKKHEEELKRLDALRRREEDWQRKVGTYEKNKQQEEESIKKKNAEKHTQPSDRARMLEAERLKAQDKTKTLKRAYSPANENTDEHLAKKAKGEDTLTRLPALKQALTEVNQNVKPKKPETPAPKPMNQVLTPGFFKDPPPALTPSLFKEGPPESITDMYNGEIPDIPSDCSDEEEEKSKPPVPAWAQSPYLRTALAAQVQRDPDHIFGKVQPLSMEDIFKGNKNVQRLHKRTSSGNWNGNDRLTEVEEENYRIQMGFK